MRRRWLWATMLVGVWAPVVAQEPSVADLRAAAERGDVASQVALAHVLRGAGQDLGGYEAAASWYRAAADRGDPEAQLELGRLILYGAVVQAPEAGIAWLEQAADHSPEAALELGMAYESGRGTAVDLQRAGELYREAADAGIAAAATRLGQLIVSGALGTVDLDEAVARYQQAAELGDPPGTFALGRAYELGLGPLEPDPARAFELYQIASQLGSGDASYRLGQIFETGDLAELDYRAAFEAYGIAAAQGHVDAHVAKGRMFEKGLGTEPSRARAYREHKAAHELGSEAGTLAYQQLRDELLKDPENTFVEVPVLFASDRAVRERGASSPRFFANAPDANGLTHTGSLRVRIAVDAGEAASRDRGRFRSNGNTSEDDVDEASLSRFDDTALRQKVLEELPKFDDRILVFVHGFWNSFEEAVAAAAQLAWDIELPALPVVYSWPSRDAGWLGAYAGDQLYAFQSAPRLAALVGTLREAAPVAEIDVLAHSMGNRLVVFAVDHLDPSIAIAELVMAAPDVPLFLLTDHSPASAPNRIEKLTAVSGRISLYAANSDRALQLAAEFDKHERVGSVRDDSVPVFVSEEAQTLDATAVKDWVGHSYIYNSATVIDDLQTIIVEHAQPAEPPRVWLTGESLPPEYWVFD